MSKYGKVCVPDSIIDTTNVTATNIDLLAGKKTINSNGDLIEGQIVTYNNEIQHGYAVTESGSLFSKHSLYNKGAVLRGEKKLNQYLIKDGATIYGVTGISKKFIVDWWINLTPTGTDSFKCTDGQTRTLYYCYIDTSEYQEQYIGKPSSFIMHVTDYYDAWSAEHIIKEGSGDEFVVYMTECVNTTSTHGWNKYNIKASDNSEKMWVGTKAEGIRIPLPLGFTSSSTASIFLCGKI